MYCESPEDPFLEQSDILGGSEAARLQERGVRRDNNCGVEGRGGYLEVAGQEPPENTLLGGDQREVQD